VLLQLDRIGVAVQIYRIDSLRRFGNCDFWPYLSTSISPRRDCLRYILYAMRGGGRRW
jgi:hypothetical protein